MSVIHPAKGTYTQLNTNDLILHVNQNAGQDNAPKKKRGRKNFDILCNNLNIDITNSV